MRRLKLFFSHFPKGLALRLKLGLTTLAVLLLSTQASARGVVFATSEDISAFDRMVSQSKERSRSRADQGQMQRRDQAQPSSSGRQQEATSRGSGKDRRPERQQRSQRFRDRERRMDSSQRPPKGPPSLPNKGR